jgi:hypothetical protein
LKAVAEHALVQLSRVAGAAPAVRYGKVVEHQQLSRSQIEGDLDVLDAKTVILEERQFGTEAVELQPAQKPRIGPDTGEEGWTLSVSSLDQPCEASLDIPSIIIPAAVRSPIGGQPIDQLSERRP